MFALRAILPWMPQSKTNPFVKPLYKLTDPVLSVIRAGLPPARMGMDVSPFIIIILLWIAHQLILRVLA
jgi:uncharacterized protein YggT (Ycf19 family)